VGAIDMQKVLDALVIDKAKGAWTQTNASAQWAAKYAHCAVDFNGKLWVMGGFGGAGPVNDVWSSTDGKTWTQATAAAPWQARMNFSAVVFNGCRSAITA
jgi:hypothetical protein